MLTQPVPSDVRWPRSTVRPPAPCCRTKPAAWVTFWLMSSTTCACCKVALAIGVQPIEVAQRLGNGIQACAGQAGLLDGQLCDAAAVADHFDRRFRWLCRRSIIDWISAVDFWVRWASSRTSSATTAKPRPCSPARAASMAALRAEFQVGLLGDGADYLEDAADLRAFGGQGTNHFHRLIDGRDSLSICCRLHHRC